MSWLVVRTTPQSVSAQQAYYAEKAKWNAAATYMDAVVQNLSKVIGMANQNYQVTENVNRSMWT